MLKIKRTGDALSKTGLERPVLAVDVVVFRPSPDLTPGRAAPGAAAEASAGLEVLLHRRPRGPFKGELALPGVAVQIDETLEDAARRGLAEKAGIPAAGLHLEQLASFDALHRDPRGRTVSVVYLGLARPGLPPSPKGLWCSLDQLPRGKLPFDHEPIIEAALLRLAGKLRYSNIAAHLLPPDFRIEELQRLYEAILGRHLNRANFRTKLLRIGLIERVGESSEVGKQGGRPAHLYRFTCERPDLVPRDFL